MMIVSTLIAATVAAAEPHASAQAPAQPHADHKAMNHGEKKMGCCDKMAKGEGCECCKDMGGKDAAAKKDGHGTHDH
jgi:hypothetical protein